MKRLVSLLFAVAMVLGLFPLAALAADVDETVLVAFGDFQHASVAEGQNRLRAILDAMRVDGTFQVDGLLCNGDYSLYYNKEQSELGLQAIRETVGDFVDGPMIFSQGNHDPIEAEGMSASGAHDAPDGSYGVYVIHEDEYSERGYNEQTVRNTAAALSTYLAEKLESGWQAPIFIVNHVPLHWGNLTLMDYTACNGYILFNVLNEFGAKGLNIIQLYGHSHGYEDDFLGGAAVYLKKGDTILVGQGEPSDNNFTEETLHFTYMNPGYLSNYSAPAEGVDTAMTATLFRIRGPEVIITRYDEHGQHNLKSAGVFNKDKFGGWPTSPQPNEDVYTSSRLVTAAADIATETPAGVAPDGLMVTNPPRKLCYLVGETLQTEGMELALRFGEVAVPYRGAYSVDGFQSETLGTGSFTVSCKGFTVTVNYEVVEELPDMPDDPDTPDQPEEPDAPILNGWIMENGRWTYYNYGEQQFNQWRRDSVGWCYLGADGYCVTNQWVRDSRGWCYLGADGRMTTNKWIRDSVGWCYVGYNGYCITNKWIKDSKGWCYLGAEGRMLTETWVKDSVGWCYLGEDGYCVTNAFRADSNGWCYLDADGRMVYNQWVKHNNKSYYLDSYGYRLTGKHTVGNYICVFNDEGELTLRVYKKER